MNATPPAQRSTDSLFEDYATEPVPAQITVSGWRIALINSALALSLPGLVAGVQLGSALGLADAARAFLLGGLIISAIGAVTGYVGVRTRLSSYMILRSSFGIAGSKVVNLCFALSLFGWFGVNASLFGQATSEIWLSLTGQSVPQSVFIVVGGVLMTFGALFGFRSLNVLSLIAIPFQILVMVILAARVLTEADLSQLLLITPVGDVSFGQAVSAVVGGWIVGAVAAPDLTRYGKSALDAVLAAAVPFLVASSLVYLVAATAGLWSGEADILAMMLAMGLGAAALALVVFSSWVTNAVNLYSCSLSITATFQGLRQWQVAVLSGVLGTVTALAGILDRFIDFIFSLGILFTPVAAIYVIDFFLPESPGSVQTEEEPSEVSYPAFVAWAAGVSVAIATSRGVFRLTGIEALDGLVSTAFLYGCFRLLTRRLVTRRVRP